MVDLLPFSPSLTYLYADIEIAHEYRWCIMAMIKSLRYIHQFGYKCTNTCYYLVSFDNFGEIELDW